MNTILQATLNDAALKLLKPCSKHTTERLAVGVNKVNDQKPVFLLYPVAETKHLTRLINQAHVWDGGLPAGNIKPASLFGGEHIEALGNGADCPYSQQQDDHRGSYRSHLNNQPCRAGLMTPPNALTIMKAALIITPAANREAT